MWIEQVSRYVFFTWFSFVEINLISVNYTFTQTTASINSNESGSSKGYLYTVIGTLGILANPNLN